MSDREFKLWLSILILFILCIVGYSVYQKGNQSEVESTHYESNESDVQSNTSIPEKDFTRTKSGKPTISMDDFQKLRTDFERHYFYSLNTRFNEWQAEFEQDVNNELKLYDAMRIFEVAIPQYESLLKDWISFSPDEWAPYLARAHYYEHNGWESRGGAWAANTSREQFDGMHYYFKKAEEDLIKCIQIKPELYLAYDLLIKVS